jgi:hypothetical protein
MKSPHYDFQKQLTDTLTQYFQAISDRDSKKIETMLHLLETLEKSAPADIAPELRHYLQRKSYRKAIEWIHATPAHTPTQ